MGYMQPVCVINIKHFMVEKLIGARCISSFAVLGKWKWLGNEEAKLFLPTHATLQCYFLPKQQHMLEVKRSRFLTDNRIWMQEYWMGGKRHFLSEFIDLVPSIMYVILILNHKHNNICGELLNILIVHLSVQVCPRYSNSQCVLYSLHPYILQENKLAFFMFLCIIVYGALYRVCKEPFFLPFSPHVSSHPPASALQITQELPSRKGED